MMHSLLDWMGYWAVKSVIVLANVLPLQGALAVGRFIGRIVYYCHPRRQVAYVNLKAAFGNERSARELKRIVLATYENIAQTAIEMFRFHKLDKKYLEEYITVEGMHNKHEALAKGKGAIFATAHFGNWELLTVVSALQGAPVKSVAREQRHARMNALLNKCREAHGNEIIGKGMALREIIQALKDNQCVGFVNDQSGGSEGIYVNFFGRETTTPPGVINIAQRTGCAVLPCFDVRKPHGHHSAYIHEPLDITDTSHDQKEKDTRAGLRSYLELLEQYIRRYPEQWLWGHKRWKYTLNRSVVVLSDKKAGHYAQSETLVDVFGEVARQKGVNVTTNVCHVEYKSAFHRAVLFVIAFFGAWLMQGRMMFLRHFLTPPSYEKISRAFADVVISCGAGTVPINVILARENLAKNIVIMKPPFPYTLSSFRFMFVPYHDRFFTRHRRRVIRLRAALSSVTPEKLAREAESLKEQFRLSNTKTISVMIGGDTKKYRYDAEWVEKSINELLHVAFESNCNLLVTTSRRTRPDIINIVKATLAGKDCCKLLVIPTEKNIENVVYGMIGIASVVVVTEDSVSMISESVQSGKKVVVLKMANKIVSKKHKRLQDQLVQGGFITVASYAAVYESLFTILTDHSERDPCQEEKVLIYNALERLI